MIRILLAILLLVIGAFAPARGADHCTQSPKPIVASYPGGGNISLSYQTCLGGPNRSSLYWDSSMTYDRVSFDGSFQLNGTVAVQLNWADGSIASLVFRNGPLVFTVGGKHYSVSFNNLAFNFDERFRLVNTTGTLSIDGVTAPADGKFLAYLLR